MSKCEYNTEILPPWNCLVELQKELRDKKVPQYHQFWENEIDEYSQKSPLGRWLHRLKNRQITAQIAAKFMHNLESELLSLKRDYVQYQKELDTKTKQISAQIDINTIEAARKADKSVYFDSPTAQKYVTRLERHAQSNQETLNAKLEKIFSMAEQASKDTQSIFGSALNKAINKIVMKRKSLQEEIQEQISNVKNYIGELTIAWQRALDKYLRKYNPDGTYKKPHSDEQPRQKQDKKSSENQHHQPRMVSSSNDKLYNVLGLASGHSHSEAAITQAYRKMMMKYKDDKGDMRQKINNARDVLLGLHQARLDDIDIEHKKDDWKETQFQPEAEPVPKSPKFGVGRL